MTQPTNDERDDFFKKPEGSDYVAPDANSAEDAYNGSTPVNSNEEAFPREDNPYSKGSNDGRGSYEQTPPAGGYGQGGGGYPQTGGYGGQGGKPNNNLVWAILSTVLCCLPLGVVSIIFAAQVDNRWATGDTRGAVDSARKAKQFAIASAIVGVVGILAYLLLFVVLGIADSTSGYNSYGSYSN